MSHIPWTEIKNVLCDIDNYFGENPEKVAKYVKDNDYIY